MLLTFFKMLFALIALGVVSGGAASAEECSGSLTAEEVLRAEDARYEAQIANDFATMEQMFGPELVYIRSVDGAVADKHAYINSMRSGTVKYRAMRRSDVRVRTYGLVINAETARMLSLAVPQIAVGIRSYDLLSGTAS